MDERETSSFSALKLPFSHMPTPSMDSPEHPLQTPASVPFKWEEQPGKPRPCTDIVTRPEPTRCLDLPPCRFTKTPSPTTVLDGPYNVGRPRFSSFRLFRDGPGPGQDSFDSFSSASPEGTAFDLLLAEKKSKTRGLFGKFKGGKKEVDCGGSCRFSPSSVSSSCESVETVKKGGGVKMKRNGSFSSVPPHARSSHLWTSICQGIKQAMQWKSSRKSNKEGRD